MQALRQGAAASSRWRVLQLTADAWETGAPALLLHTRGFASDASKPPDAFGVRLWDL